MKRKWSTIVLSVFAAFSIVAAQERANPNTRNLQDFEKRLAEYLKLRKQATSTLPKLKTTPEPSDIKAHERACAVLIKQARAQAKRGDIFTPEIEAEFRRLIDITMKGADAARIKSSLKRAEPVSAKMVVNDTYPDSVPLQSAPPTLLLNLPKLPAELDYRVVGRALILRDVEANIMIDFIPDVMPAT